MNPAENCLKYLYTRNWIELAKILTNNIYAKELAESSTFSIFESNFVDELVRHENETNEDLFIVASRIFQIHNHDKSNFKLSQNAIKGISRFLFNKKPDIVYAKYLDSDQDVQLFLEKHRISLEKTIEKTFLSGNLNIRIGDHGELQFDKEIFNNSPQEKELYFAAKQTLPDYILLPNTALSTIIDPKVCKLLDTSTSNFFYKSTLDLCIVNPVTFRPIVQTPYYLDTFLETVV